MSRVARKSARRRIQPYAWLGAGAVTLGMGAAMVGGAAVAYADTGTDSTSTASGGTSSEAPSTKREPAKTRATRAARASAVADNDASVVTGPARRGQVSDVAPEPEPVDTSDPAPAATVTATPAAGQPEAESTADGPLPAAATPVATPKRANAWLGRGASVDESLPDPVAATELSPAPQAIDPAPAAAVTAVGDPGIPPERCAPVSRRHASSR